MKRESRQEGLNPGVVLRIESLVNTYREDPVNPAAVLLPSFRWKTAMLDDMPDEALHS